MNSKSQWHIQGESCVGIEGCRNDKYFNNFVGRSPSQFSPSSTWVENGKLILETRWDPTFNFSSGGCKTFSNVEYCFGTSGGESTPIITAAVNSYKLFQRGYMEIKCKAADAEITSSFWIIGAGAELDMFEMFGKYEIKSKEKEKELKLNIIDWASGTNINEVVNYIDTDWRVADEFHVYGFDWGASSLKVYIDGKLTQTIVASDHTNGKWILDGPQRIWVD